MAFDRHAHTFSNGRKRKVNEKKIYIKSDHVWLQEPLRLECAKIHMTMLEMIMNAVQHERKLMLTSS